MRGENIFGVKIVNAGTCVVKYVNAASWGVNVEPRGKRLGEVATWRHGKGGTDARGKLAEEKVCGGLIVMRRNERRSELAVAGTCVEKAVERTSVRIGACALRAQELRVERPRGKCPSSQMPKAKEAPSPRCLP